MKLILKSYSVRRRSYRFSYQPEKSSLLTEKYGPISAELVNLRIFAMPPTLFPSTVSIGVKSTVTRGREICCNR